MRAPFQNNHRIWPSTNSVMEAWAKSNSQFDRNWWMYGRALLGCFLQIHLPINQTCRYGTPMLHLCPSECIFLICVPFLFDWCMIQVKQLVRKDQIVKKDNTWPDRLTYQSTQNGNNGKPTPYLLTSDSIFLIYNQFWFDWCMNQVKHLMRRDRIRKKDNNWGPHGNTYLSTKNGIAKRPRTYLQPSSNSLFCTIWHNSRLIDVW